MPVQLISASGVAYPLIINPDGSLNINMSGLSLGSVSISAGSEVYVKAGSVIVTSMPAVNVTTGSEVYVKAGSVIITNSLNGSFAVTNAGSVIQGTSPWLVSGTITTYEGAYNSGYNPSTSIIYVGSMVGSIYKKLSTGSLLKVLTYDAGSNVTAVSAWTVV
jgi:hypothetical protein